MDDIPKHVSRESSNILYSTEEDNKREDSKLTTNLRRTKN